MCSDSFPPKAIQALRACQARLILLSVVLAWRTAQCALGELSTFCIPGGLLGTRGVAGDSCLYGEGATLFERPLSCKLLYTTLLRPGGLLGARGVAGDSCLYGETYALRTVRARYPDSARAQQAAQYYLGGGPALTGPQILLRVFNVNVTALQAYQSDPEVRTPAGSSCSVRVLVSLN